MIERYVSGRTAKGWAGTFVAVSTDNDAIADRAAAAYAKDKGWKAPRVRRSLPRVGGEPCVKLPQRYVLPSKANAHGGAIS